MKLYLLFFFMIAFPLISHAQSVDKLLSRFYEAYEPQEFSRALVFVQDAQEKLTGLQIYQNILTVLKDLDQTDYPNYIFILERLVALHRESGALNEALQLYEELQHQRQLVTKRI